MKGACCCLDANRSCDPRLAGLLLCPPSLAVKNKQPGDGLRQSAQPTSCREKDGGHVLLGGADRQPGITNCMADAPRPWPTRPAPPRHATMG